MIFLCAESNAERFIIYTVVLIFDKNGLFKYKMILTYSVKFATSYSKDNLINSLY